MSDRDEDHREPRGTFEDYLRDQRAANECECGRFMFKVGGVYACTACTPEEETADV